MSQGISVLFPLLWIFAIEGILIDYVEVRDVNNSTDLTNGTPLKFVKYITENEIVVQDHACVTHIVSKSQISDYYAINGSLTDKTKCHITNADVARIVTAKKTRFGIVQTTFSRLSQHIFDSNGDLLLQTDIEYQIVATDPDKSLDVVFDNNCKRISLKDDMITTTLTKIVSTNDLMNCDNARLNLSLVIANQTNGTNFVDIVPYEINPEEIDVDINEIPIALTIKELMIKNVVKSNLVLTNLNGSIKVKSFCPHNTTNSTVTTTEFAPTTMTYTETQNLTITKSSEIIRISPTTITEKLTKTKWKTSTSTKNISVTSTKILKPVTSTVTEWSTLQPETSFIYTTETLETTKELNITLTITDNVTLPVVTETVEHVSLSTVVSTSTIQALTKVTKTRLLDILITKTRKICPTRSNQMSTVQPTTIRRLSRDVDSSELDLFKDPISLNQSMINQYLPTFEDHQKSLNMTSDLAYKWLNLGYGYKSQKAIEYLEDNNLPINHTVESIERYKKRYDQLRSVTRPDADKSSIDDDSKAINPNTISRQRRQNLSDEKVFWYNLTQPYFDKKFGNNPLAYPQWLINLYEIPQEYKEFFYDYISGPIGYEYKVIKHVPQELAWKFLIQRIGLRAQLGELVLIGKNITDALRFLKIENIDARNHNYKKVKDWIKSGVISFKEDKSIQFPPGTPLPYLYTPIVTSMNSNNDTQKEFRRSITEQFERETEELRNKTLETLEDLLSINNRFDNKSYLAGVGAYGIQFSRQGSLFAFFEEYLFVFRIKLPIANLHIPDDYNRGSCHEFLTYLPTLGQTNRASGQKLYEALNNTCIAFEDTMLSMTEQINRTAIMAVKEFQLRTLSRSKRFDPFTLAVVGIAAAASFAVYAVTSIENGRSERKELFRHTLELERKSAKIAESVEILSDAFLGFQRTTLESFKEFDTKVEVLRNYTIEQGIFLKQAIINATNFLDDKSMFSTIMSNVNAYRLAHTNVMQNKLILILDQIRQLESIFVVLNEGVLSHELLPWAKLEKLLEKIEKRFSKDFVFGILPSERHLYYQLPLTAYSIDTITNDLYVSLKIPLIRRNRVRTYEIIKIQANPFICQNETCFNFGNTEKAISFDLNGRLLLADPSTGLLLNEVDHDTLICRYQSHRKICHTFSPNIFHEVSSCHRSIFDFNAIDIAKNCPLTQRDINEYIPTAVTNNAYIIHSKIVPSFDILCQGRNPLRVPTQGWAQVIELTKGCDIYLTSLGKILYGPLGEIMKSKENITLFQSELITLIEEASNQTKFDFSQFSLTNDSVIHLSDFDSTKHNITLSWDKSTVNRYADYINKVSRNITNVIQEMRSITGRKFSSYSLRGFVGSLTGIIQVMSTLILVFGVLTYSKLLGYTSSLTIIAPRRVEAFSLDLGFDILPNDYATLIDMTTALTLLIMIGLIVKITFFRKHFITSHFVRGEGLLSADSKYKISINIAHTTNHLCSINTENIYISIPLNRFNRLKHVRDMRPKNILYTWLIKEDNGRMYLKFAEDLQLIAIDENDTTHSTYQRIFLALDKMGYLYSGKPMAFAKANTYGKAMVSITRRIDNNYGEPSNVNETKI